MKLIPIILILSLTNCSINWNQTAEVYTSEVSDVDKGLYIHTENGTISPDTIRAMFDDYIPKYDAAPVFIDDDSDPVYSPIIVNGYGEPILFDSDESLIYYMAHRGYDFDGLETFKKKRYQSIWVFIKIKQ